jgi:ribosomal protein S18 acetylase RimI-like enzyme
VTATNCRPATAGDLDWVLALNPLAHSDARRQRFLRAAVEEGRCEIARRDGERAAFACWHRQFFSRPFLALLVVGVRHRRCGIGSVLVRHLAARLAAEDPLFTSTNASNTAAQAFFERLGFVRSGTIDHLDPGDPEWIYALLTPSG